MSHYRHHTRSRCKRTKKLQFPDELAAKLAMAEIENRDDSRRIKKEVRAYQCNFCRKWHLTSQDLKVTV